MSEHRDPDAQVDEFLELERELSAGRRASKTYEEGNVSEAAKIPASEVPDDYPVAIRTRQALQLNVETPDGETVATYLEWPGEGEESDHVEQLLDALGRGRDEFANVYGDRVALDSEDGWHGIDAEKTAALRGTEIASGDGSLDKTRNLLAVAIAVGAVGLLLDDAFHSLSEILLIITIGAIPVGIYLDAEQVKDGTSWSPTPNPWIIGGMIPIANVAVGLAYLVERHVRLSGITSGERSGVWYKALLTSVAALPLALTINPVSEIVSVAIFGYSWCFTPLAVYFDAEYVEDASDWEPKEELWAVAVFFTSILGAGAYLLRRYQKLD
ncbi:hypothetical protein [Halorussus aquaticus]|uniref:Uncharacterized protein n=1 Tax=Halorussus aquaticus TaxID=2953748 RepID=A0ABD5Q8X8_9EURY|nr:hypothetical protein [Halorussus aquaticus]